MVRFRKSLKGTTNAERDAILTAEGLARKLAVEFICAKRCAEHPLGLADCSDIRVRLSRVRWARRDGQILFHCVVLVRGEDMIQTFKWRLKIPMRLPNVRHVVHSWGLTPG